MTTSPRDDALISVAASLRNINNAGSGWLSSNALTQIMRHAPDANYSGYRPFAYFGNEITETTSRVSSSGSDDIYDRVMTFELTVIGEHADPDAEANNTLHDLEYALSDPTLGSTISDFEITRNRTVVQERSFLVSVTCNLHYRTSRLTPSQRV